MDARARKQKDCFVALGIKRRKGFVAALQRGSAPSHRPATSAKTTQLTPPMSGVGPIPLPRPEPGDVTSPSAIFEKNYWGLIIFKIVNVYFLKEGYSFVE